MAFFAKAANISESELELISSHVKHLFHIYKHNGTVGTFPRAIQPLFIDNVGVFATRNIEKDEIFHLTFADIAKLHNMNDGAAFGVLACAKSHREMQEFYCYEMERYKLDSVKYANCRIVCVDEFDGVPIGTLLVTKEGFRTHGIPAWMVMLPEYLDLPFYADWVAEAFPELLAEANPRNKWEAMSALANCMGRLF